MHFDGRNMQDSVPECILASALSFNFLGLPILVLAKTACLPASENETGKPRNCREVRIDIAEPPL
jgi:hypothetical protein